MKLINREIVAAVIFSKDRKILFGKKNSKKGGVYIDCWHIPGGGVNSNETHIQALKREINEEVGIDVEKYNNKLLDNSGRGSSERKLKNEIVQVNMNFTVYQVDIIDKKSNEIQISLNDDLSEYKWVSIQELNTIKLTPPSTQLFTKLGYLKK